MHAPDVLVYPRDVLTGAPFDDLETATVWMHRAAHLPYPGMDTGDGYWTDHARLRPVLVTEVPSLAFDVDPDDLTAVREAWTQYDDDGTVLPLDLPTWIDLPAYRNETDAWEYRARFGLDHYRHLQGIADAMRRALPQARSRRSAARDLGDVERALERVSASTVAYMNGLTCGLWRMAILSGHDTDPANPYAPDADRLRVNPAGIPRLA